MTCIVGLADGDRVWIGGDSCGIDPGDLSRVSRVDEKVFRNGPYVLGFTSSFRFGQLLRYAIELPVPDTWDVNRFMVTTFMNAIREAMKTHGFMGTDTEGRESLGSFLVAFEDKLYEINDDLQVGINRNGAAAVGCGALIALGALHAMNREPFNVDAQSRLTRALEAAEYHSGGVAGPFTLLSTKG